MKKRSKNLARAVSDKSAASSLPARCGKAFAAALVLTAALFCLAAVVFVNIDLPHKLYSQAAAALTAVSVLTVSYIFARVYGNFGLITGFALAISLYIVILLVSVLIMKYQLTGKALIVLAMLTAAGSLGGLAGTSSSYKRKIT